MSRQEFSKKLKSYIKSEEFRNILKSCAIAFVLLVLFSATILAYGSNLSFLTQSSTFAAGSKGEVIDNAYENSTNKVTYHIDPQYNEMKLINDLRAPLDNSCEYYTVSWNIYSYLK